MTEKTETFEGETSLMRESSWRRPTEIESREGKSQYLRESAWRRESEKPSGEEKSETAAADKKPQTHNGLCGSCPERFAQKKKAAGEVESDSTAVESSTDEDERWKDIERTKDTPPSYYEVQKLLKYVKGGNPTATIVALCCMKDYDLTTHINQFAIQDANGVETLINVLEISNSKCLLGALAVLADITLNIDIRKTLVDLDGIPLLVNILNSSEKNLRQFAADTLANVAKVRVARKFIRACGGVPKLVDLLDIKESILQTPRENLCQDDLESLDMARAGGRALWTCADSRHNRELMRKSGIVPMMEKLLMSIHTDVVIPIMGTIEKCLTEPKFQLAIKTQGMIEHIVRHLNSDSLDLKLQSSRAISKAAYDQEARDLVRDARGLEPLVAIIKDMSLRTNTPLIIGATAALWSCSISDSNAEKLGNLGAVIYLLSLLNEASEDVLTNAVGAISECLRLKNNRDTFRNANGIPALVALLNSSHAPLLQNLSRALKECAEDIPSMRILEELDAVRLIWSLLKNPEPKVQAYAAYAICPCVLNAQESGELVRSLVGAMELVVELLDSKDLLVLSAVCAAIATIAKDNTNLAILTDLKVIYKLAVLINNNDDRLRENLAIAIASCAPFGNNTQELGKLRTVTPIVSYMASDDPRVHRATAMALEKLSVDPENAITMHQSGVIPFLLEGIGSSNKDLQLAAANCLRNIRELALDVEDFLLKIDD